MSEPTQPTFDVRGAVDLSALTRPQSPPPGEEGGAPAAGGYVVDVTDETFGQLVQDSAQYPVVVLLWIPCLVNTSPRPRVKRQGRMPTSARK